jgi:phosphoribosylaminoimidazole (AIR) synthetase
MTKKLTYASAGVSLDRWEKTYKHMKRLVDATRTKGALSKVGTFGGLNPSWSPRRTAWAPS